MGKKDRPEADSFPCPLCEGRKGYIFHKDPKMKMKTTEDWQIEIRLFEPEDPPRCASCLACRGTIQLPEPGSTRWKDPNQCVCKTFAQARAKRHARTAIQEATP